MADKEIVYLIDGSSYIFRAYHAIRLLTNSEGFPTNAIYGFTNMLLKFIKDFQPHYMGVVFDAKKENFRNDIYHLYKANRGEPPDDLKPQFEEIFNLVKAFNIPMLRKEGFEADDIIGTLAKYFENKNFNVVIVTGDKDFCQVVDDSITLLDTMRDKVTGVAEVIEKYGVAPEKLVDIFALTGDSIDNIPGVKGIGAKIAASLIKEYGSLEGVYQNLDSIKPRYKELLEASRDNAYMSRELVRIKLDVEIEKDIKEYSYDGFDKDKLSGLFQKFEFTSLLKDLDKNDDADKAKPAADPSSSVSYDNYKLVNNEKEFEDLINYIYRTGKLSIDLETTSQLPMEADIVGFALAPEPHNAFYIPVGHRNLLESLNQLSLTYVIDKLKPLIEDEEIKKIGQNLKYEYVVLSKYGIRMRGIYFDAMIAAHLIDSSRVSYSLDELARIYLGHKTITYSDVTGTGRSRISFDEADIETARVYACEDADVAYLLYELLYKKLGEFGLLDVYDKYLLDLIVTLAVIEINGVKIDRDRLSRLSAEFDSILASTEKDIYSAAGAEFNLNSPLQLREILFEKLGLPVKKKTKKGDPSTDVDVLTDLSKEHRVPELMLRYRALSKLKSTYIDALPRLINIKTNRIHTSFNQVGTSTGRVSSSDPNLQNIPIRTEEGMMIREAFIAEEGFTLLSADYSQIELRLLAHFSEDQNLIDAFHQGKDIHNRTASEIFGVAEGDVNPEMRRLAKNINFGIIYGISAYGLARQTGSSVSTAREYIDQYFSRYSRVKGYLEGSIKKAQELGYAETLIGRRRQIPDLKSNDRSVRGFGERAAINTPIQGSAADIINVAMININKFLENNYKSKMILQVHDELLFEIAREEEGETIKEIKSKMEGAWELNVPLAVDIKTGNNWASVY